MIYGKKIVGENYKEGRGDISIKANDIHNDLIKEIGVKDFSILIAITSFCNKSGVAIVSQREISQYTGLSLGTVNNSINGLIRKKFNGKFILNRKFVKFNMIPYSVYRINKNIISK